MARFSCNESCTSRTVDGPRVQSTRRISSSDAVGFCGGRFMEKDHTTKMFVVSTKIFVCVWNAMHEWLGIRFSAECEEDYSPRFRVLQQFSGMRRVCCKFCASNRTGETVLLNPAGQRCGLFLWRAHAQSGF